jgi:hypothetical protein
MPAHIAYTVKAASAHCLLQVGSWIAHYMGTAHVEVKGVMLNCSTWVVQLGTRGLHPVRCASVHWRIQVRGSPVKQHI